VDNGTLSEKLLDIYQRLMECYGPQHWWPAQEPFEVMVGAVLTQSAAWANVEKAIVNLNKAGALSPGVLRRLSMSELAGLIRPCGYYNAKALKLNSLAQWLGEHYNDDLNRLFADGALRQQLLSVHGIGKETADSIMLYAAGKPVFVVDAYARRIISRIGWTPEQDNYEAYQAIFTYNLPSDVRLFNEYHALLVRLGKEVCHKQPLCWRCCLQALCQSGFPVQNQMSEVRVES
jgi:endonuclease-3 related protein